VIVNLAPISIIGAGPTGTLLAILLHRHGIRVNLYEKRSDPREDLKNSGRSINLALADRGLHALAQAGVLAEISHALMPMRGRLIHHIDGTTVLQPYGQTPDEINHSVSRLRLNQILVEVAARQPGIKIHFEHSLEDADFKTGIAKIRDLGNGRIVNVRMQPLLATDGAGSAIRRELSQQQLINAHEVELDHGYKELSIPAGKHGQHLLAPDVLHIWPRGSYMLIALPNSNGSFTATLFLPKNGAESFASLNTATIDRFFSDTFPDVRALMPNCVREFSEHAVGFLGTVYANPWHYQSAAAIIGDAAHAIVPFHGQGMNCCFEDCIEFDACVMRNNTWEAIFSEFESIRKPNTDAIATMALENYLEMREHVAHAKFQLQQSLALELERRHPQHFIPRYSMVMFHHEIPYHVALNRGLVQSKLLAELTLNASTLAEVDFAKAEREIKSQLPPFVPAL